MLQIMKQDILKTILIVWLFAATGYILFDLYNGYKIKGIQAAYQQGFSESIDQIIQQMQKSGCAPFEIQNGEAKAKIVDAQCLPQEDIAQPDGQPFPSEQKNGLE